MEVREGVEQDCEGRERVEEEVEVEAEVEELIGEEVEVEERIEEYFEARERVEEEAEVEADADAYRTRAWTCAFALFATPRQCATSPSRTHPGLANLSEWH